jgi:hypothetical protein
MSIRTRLHRLEVHTPAPVGQTWYATDLEKAWITLRLCRRVPALAPAGVDLDAVEASLHGPEADSAATAFVAKVLEEWRRRRAMGPPQGTR